MKSALNLKNASLQELESLHRESPTDPAISARLAQVLLNRNRDDEALARIEDALQHRPDDAQYWYIRALILRKFGRTDDAVESWERAAGLSPIEGKAYALADFYLDHLNRPNDAKRVYARVIRYSRRETPLISLRRLGQCCLQGVGVNEALLRTEQAIAPFLPPIRALEGMAMALAREGRYEEARSCCDILRLEDQNNAAGLLTLAQIATERHHDLALAEGYYRCALRSHPKLLDVHRLWMFHLVRAGEYEQARLYFVNFFLKDMQRLPSLEGRPLTDGVDLNGKSLLFAGRPGFGDYFQLLRFASVFHHRGAHVVVECVESLWDLIQTIPGVDAVTEEGSDSDEFDYQVDTWSVFLFVEDCLDWLRRCPPYIFPPASVVDRWRKRLTQKRPSFNVGISWASSDPCRNPYTGRNVPVNLLEKLGNVPSVVYHSLQVSANDASLRESGLPIVNLASELSSFTETAGVMKNMDVVVSVENSVAHLAGALGRPTFILLPFSPDPRWMLKDAFNPWYPSARLFRQSSPGDWSQPLSAVAEALENMAASKLQRELP